MKTCICSNSQYISVLLTLLAISSISSTRVTFNPLRESIRLPDYSSNINLNPQEKLTPVESTSLGRFNGLNLNNEQNLDEISRLLSEVDDLVVQEDDVMVGDNNGNDSKLNVKKEVEGIEVKPGKEIGLKRVIGKRKPGRKSGLVSKKNHTKKRQKSLRLHDGQKARTQRVVPKKSRISSDWNQISETENAAGDDKLNRILSSLSKIENEVESLIKEKAKAKTLHKAQARSSANIDEELYRESMQDYYDFDI